MITDLLDHESILFSSAIGEGLQPLVKWQQGQYSGLWIAEGAILMAESLLVVAGMSFSEAYIASGLTEMIAENSGEKELSNARIWQAIRASRVAEMEYLRPIFGTRTGQPLIEVGWYKTARTVSIEGAIEEAGLIMSAANTAIVDVSLSAVLAKRGFSEEDQELFFRELIAERADRSKSDKNQGV
jgi:uncharacterized SAM-binding protein YcdF (DUF218 family)